MDNKMTIKELADELGVSKDKVKYQVKKLLGNLPSKINGVTYLSDTDSKVIRAVFEDATEENPLGKTGELPSILPTLPTDYLAKELEKKEDIIREKDSQIITLIESQRHIQNLLDQQQQLQLKTQQLLEEKTKLLDIAQQKKWWQFWK